MEIVIFYVLIFIIGTLFGSFSTLAVYRIPLHEDITHKRSFCTKCNHKLSFWDMIPVLSYIFLGGKCRYCKKKIRIRYLILEIFTGLVFLLFAMSLNINLMYLEISKFVYLIFGMLYIAGLIIIAGIDKENKKITKGVLTYEIIILSIYMIYLYIVEGANIYRYVIYLFVMFILLLIDTIKLKKLKVDSYLIQILVLCMIESIFTYGYGFFATAIMSLLAISIEIVIRKIFKKDKRYLENLPIGYYLCVTNIIAIIIINVLACRL